MIKKQIRITYLATLATDVLDELLENGVETKQTLMRGLRNNGIHTVAVRDYEVETVEDIEEVK
jgi:hypothetical protein